MWHLIFKLKSLPNMSIKYITIKQNRFRVHVQNRLPLSSLAYMVC